MQDFLFLVASQSIENNFYEVMFGELAVAGVIIALCFILSKSSGSAKREVDSI